MNDFTDSHRLGQSVSATIPVTFFPDRFAKTMQGQVLTWPELVNHVLDCGVYDSKDKAPFIKLAEFMNKPTERGCLRHNDGVTCVSGVEGDYDQEQMSIDVAAQLLRDANIKAILYASANNHRLNLADGSFTGPRWRVLVPFAKPLPPSMRRAFMAKVNHVLGGVLGRESFNLSQSYYLGKIKGAYWQCEVVEGDFIDELDVIVDLPETYPDDTSDTPSFGNVALLDPSTKTGPVGYFCKAFDTQTAIERFLPDVFVRQTQRRYDWVGHDPGGLWLHDDGQHFGGCHDSWPFGTNRVANTFDLVRQFKFDPEFQEPQDTPPHERPSYQAMVQWMQTLPELTALGFDPNARSAPMDLIEFEDLAPAPQPSTQADSTTTPPPQPPALLDTIEPFPGPMHDLVQAMVAASPREQPLLSVGAALAAMASACPGFYRLPDGTRMNLYLLGVSPSATGKDMPRAAAEELAALVGARLIGGDMTGQGLEDALPEQDVASEALLLSVDEVGLWLSNQTETNAKSEYKSLAKNLLKLFSASSNKFVGRTLANKPTKVFKNPTVNVLGFSTPGALAESVSYRNIADGLLGRMLVLRGLSTVRSKRVQASFEMPKSLRDRAADLNAVKVYDTQTLATGLVVTVSDQAEAALNAAHIRFEDMQNDDEIESTLCRRSFEKVQRIAGVLAVWDCPAQPVMKPEHVQWADRFVALSNQTIVAFAGQEVSTKDPLEQVRKVELVCRKILSGEIKPMSKWDQDLVTNGKVPRALALRRAKLSKKDFDAALAHLESEQICSVDWVKTERKPVGFIDLQVGL